MTDLKLIDELVVDLMQAYKLRPAALHVHGSSVVREAMKRLRQAWSRGELETLTLSLANHFRDLETADWKLWRCEMSDLETCIGCGKVHDRCLCRRCTITNCAPPASSIADDLPQALFERSPADDADYWRKLAARVHAREDDALGLPLTGFWEGKPADILGDLRKVREAAEKQTGIYMTPVNPSRELGAHTHGGNCPGCGCLHGAVHADDCDAPQSGAVGLPMPCTQSEALALGSGEDQPAASEATWRDRKPML